MEIKCKNSGILLNKVFYQAFDVQNMIYCIENY